jgi:hypothetical protein
LCGRRVGSGRVGSGGGGGQGRRGRCPAGSPSLAQPRALPCPTLPALPCGRARPPRCIHVRVRTGPPPGSGGREEGDAAGEGAARAGHRTGARGAAGALRGWGADGGGSPAPVVPALGGPPGLDRPGPRGRPGSMAPDGGENRNQQPPPPTPRRRNPAHRPRRPEQPLPSAPPPTPLSAGATGMGASGWPRTACLRRCVCVEVTSHSCVPPRAASVVPTIARRCL